MNSRIVQAKFDELPENLKYEVLDYIEFLLQKYGKLSEKRKFNFDWEGGLAELKEEYTSVELQHKVLEWR